MKIILAFIHDLFSEWMMVGQINITEWAEEVKKKRDTRLTMTRRRSVIYVCTGKHKVHGERRCNIDSV